MDTLLDNQKKWISVLAAKEGISEAVYVINLKNRAEANLWPINWQTLLFQEAVKNRLLDDQT